MLTQAHTHMSANTYASMPFCDVSTFRSNTSDDPKYLPVFHFILLFQFFVVCLYYSFFCVSFCYSHICLICLFSLWVWVRGTSQIFSSFNTFSSCCTSFASSPCDLETDSIWRGDIGEVGLAFLTNKFLQKSLEMRLQIFRNEGPNFLPINFLIYSQGHRRSRSLLILLNNEAIY